MQENKNPTPEQQTQKPSLWRRCQQKIKDWRWELEEHPGRFSLDIQGAVARLAARLRTLRAKAKQLSYAKKAHQFPESDHPAAQLFLLGIGSLPRLGSALREKWMHRRKFRIHLSARLRRASTSSGCTRRSFSGAPWPSRPSRSCSRCTRSAHPSAMTALTSGRFRGAASSAAPFPSSRASRARRWATRRIRSIPRGSRRRRGSSRASSSRAARTSSTT